MSGAVQDYGGAFVSGLNNTSCDLAFRGLAETPPRDGIVLLIMTLGSATVIKDAAQTGLSLSLTIIYSMPARLENVS